MFVGETGVGRIIQRTCEAMNEAGIEDPYDIEAVRALGVIDLPTIQKKLNLHYSLSLDLFGSEVSTNAANAFNAGIKGRYRESQDRRRSPARGRDLSGRAAGGRHDRHGRRAGPVRDQHAAARRLHPRRLGRRQTLEHAIDKLGIPFEMKLPHEGFHRQIGVFAGAHVTPDGELVSADEWQARRDGVAAERRRRRLHRSR